MDTRTYPGRSEPRISRTLILAAALAACAAGCGASQSSTTTSGGAYATPATTTAAEPPPDVRDCTIISLSVPTKYVCNGKVYTSNELRRLRQAGEGNR